MVPVAVRSSSPVIEPLDIVAVPSVRLVPVTAVALTFVKFPSTGVNDPITVLLIEPPDIVRLSST